MVVPPKRDSEYDTKSVADGGTEQFDPITGLDVGVYNEDWQQIDAAAPVLPPSVERW